MGEPGTTADAEERELEPPPPSSRRRWLFAVKLVLSVALLAFLIGQTDAGRLWAQMRRASPLWLVAALGIYLLMILVSAWRWRQLLLAQGTPASTGYLTRSYLVATFAGNFLPSNIGGDVIRVKDTVRVAGSLTLATATVLLDRGIGLLGLTVVAAIGGTLLRHGTDTLAIAPAWLWLISIGGLGALGLLVAQPHLIDKTLGPLKKLHQEWVEARLRRLVQLFEHLKASPGKLLACVLGAVVVQAILVAFHAAVAASLRIPVPVAHLAILVPLSFIVQMLPVSVNGFGVREATFTAYFATLGLPSESALALSFLATGTIMVFSLAGIPAYLTRR